MELGNINIKIKTNNGEIKSIKYKNDEILYQGNQTWKKTFPVIFPVVGFSDAFEIEGKNYKIPKHGFWKDLEWNEFIENGDVVLTAIHLANETYPFTIDIQQFISIIDNSIQIQTNISNISKETAYFHFGLHPAFNIDELSKLKYKSNKLPYKIDFDGKLKKEYKLDKEFMKVPFGKDFDTLVYKDVDIDTCSFRYNNHLISITHDANNLQLWKPENDSFICIEPWYGEGDREKELIKSAKDKKEINLIESGSTWTSNMIIKFD